MTVETLQMLSTVAYVLAGMRFSSCWISAASSVT